MPSTMALLEKALAVKRAAAWARDLNLTESAFTQAKKRGRLSPTMAGTLAEQLHEDALKWTAVAAIEAEPDSPLRNRLLQSIERAWRHS
jgi:hypothetical protein